MHVEKWCGSPSVPWFYQCNPITEDEGQIRQESMLKAEDEVIIIALRLRQYNMVHSHNRPVFSFPSTTIYNDYKLLLICQQRSQCLCACVINKMATFCFYHIQLSLLCSFIVSLASPQTTCFWYLVCSFCIQMYSNDFFLTMVCVGKKYKLHSTKCAPQ